MPVSIGYLLPTREAIMAGQPATRPLLDLAERAERLGYASLWVGDSLVARPRHEALSLLAAVAARTSRAAIGTAVLIPAMRQPVLLAHQVATVDRISEGRLILGVGIGGGNAQIQAEFATAGMPFDHRVGRMVEGLELCRQLWSGGPVTFKGTYYAVDNVSIGPSTHTPGGPPIWAAGGAEAGQRRAGRLYDGWFPIGYPTQFCEGWERVREAASVAGRDASRLTGANYLTLAIHDDRAKADEALNRFMASYYPAPPEVMRRVQGCYAGPAAGVPEWIAEYVAAGASHFVLRFAGDHEKNLDLLAGLAESLS